jgi:hypothetical protein
MSKLFSHIAFALFFYLLPYLVKKDTVSDSNPDKINTFDSTLVKAFFNDHPQLKNYQSDVENCTANINFIIYGIAIIE